MEKQTQKKGERLRVLAVESSAETASVCVMENGMPTALYRVEERTHSATLLPMAISALQMLNRTVAEVDLLAVANGPGSFTGIRIGVSTIKGLAFANNLPCVGVSTLMAMAYQLRGLCGVVCPVLNARRNQVYTALFRLNEKEDLDRTEKEPPLTRLTGDALCPMETLDALLAPYDGPVFFLGDAAETVFHAVRHPKKALPPLLLRSPGAYGVALLGEAIYSAAADKLPFTAERLAPSYLMKSQPEREREEREQAKEKSHES